ncbi:MAG: sigma-70 family RNA polymerase sigma factor [Clostridiales bacterium]|nr:sigma-70 family RNA polymerase sigma factor [Clostridiales bacterium]
MADVYNEAILIEKAKSGDEASFELLIQNCKTKAYNTALRYLRDEEDAMDVLQESLIKVFRHLNKFKGDCKFDTWVYRIVVNTCNDFLRKNKNQRTNVSLYRTDEDGETMIEIPDTAPTPSEVFDAKLTTSCVLNCLNEIPKEQKDIIILRDIQGFSYEEIGQILNCSMGTVKSRINRARQKLKQSILEQYDRSCV